MDAIGTLLSGPLAHAIGWALVHMMWQGVLVAAILAATLSLMQRQSANARYLASCGALVLLVALTAATAWRAYDSTLPATPEAFTRLAALDATVSDAGSDAVAVSPQPASWHDTLATAVTFANDHLPQIVLAWLTGVLLLSVRLLFGWLRAHRIATRNAGEAASEWQRIAARLSGALQMRGVVRLLESAAVEVPTVIGFLRPVILLPAATLSGLSIEQMEMILAHELAHIRRHDFFVNLMQAMVETLFFYHPAVWWISRRIRIEREHCCDDVAVAVCGNALLYARALTRLEELRVDSAHAVLAANGGSLLARIRRLAGTRAESPNGPGRWAAGAALLTVLAVLLISPSLPLRADKAKDNPPGSQLTVTPAPEATPSVKVKEAKCTVDVEADSDNDAEAPDPDEEDAAAMVVATPAIAPRAMALAPPALAIAPRAMASAVAGGVRGGIRGGVYGGIPGGVVDGVIEGVVQPTVRAVTAVAPMIAARVAANMELPIELNDEPTPRPEHAPRVRMHRQKIGASGKLTVDDLIELRAAGVTPAYIEQIRAAGLGDLSLDDIASLRAQGVTPEYVAQMRATGLKVDNAETAVELRAMGVSPDYISQMRSAGYSSLSIKQLVSLRAMGVTPKYVQEIAGAGYRNLSADDLMRLRSQGVTPDFIKSLAEAGYTNLSVKDLTRMAAMGVNAEFIRELSKYKTK